MTTIDKSNAHYSFSSENAPSAYAKDGDTVKFRCQDCYNGQILHDGYDFSNVNMKLNNPVTGPLYIEGAEPGDVLRIEIIDIEIESTGSMCARTGAGIYEIDGCHCRRINIENGSVKFDNDIRIPIKPMIGVIGTAPESDVIPTQTPGEHGGNMDIKDLGAGCLLYLPVAVTGGLLSMGDIHAVQGDGETVICALEMSGDITVKIDVLKNRNDIPTPFIVTKEKYLTTAADKSLDVCSIKAARKMHMFLQQHAGLTDAQSGMLLSLAGNLRISQVVNPAKGCIMEFPIGLAKEVFEK